MHSIRSNILWIWQSAKGVHRRIVLNCAVGLVRIVLSLCFVYLCKHIVDIATGSVAGNIYHWTGLLIAYIVLQLCITLYNTRLRERNRIELTNQLQQRIFAKAMLSQWNGRDSRHTGDTMSRLSEDIRAVCETVSEYLPLVLLASVQLVAASVVLFLLGKELLWIILVIMPVAIVASKLYFKKLRQLTQAVRLQEGSIQSHIQEHLLKRVLIMCMGRLEEAITALSRQQEKLQSSVIERVNYSSRANLFLQMGFMAGYNVTFCWGAFGIMAGTVTYGMMTAFLQLVNQVQMPIANMSRYLPKLIQSMASIDRLREVDQEKQMDIAPTLEIDSERQLGLQLNNLGYTYPDNTEPTLSGLNYVFEPGSRTAIVGPTGQGKSTLIRLLLGLLAPDEGSITLFDDKGETYDQLDRRLFAYVPQGNSLMSGTVRDNLRLGNPSATDAEMKRVLHLAAADFVFEREGLETSCAEQGNGLSEGQAQRIAIARALLQPGRIFLFDEACSALDDHTERQILDNLDKELAGKTIIWITHDNSVKERMQKVLAL